MKPQTLTSQNPKPKTPNPQAQIPKSKFLNPKSKNLHYIFPKSLIPEYSKSLNPTSQIPKLKFLKSLLELIFFKN